MSDARERVEASRAARERGHPATCECKGTGLIPVSGFTSGYAPCTRVTIELPPSPEIAALRDERDAARSNYVAQNNRIGELERALDEARASLAAEARERIVETEDMAGQVQATYRDDREAVEAECARLRAEAADWAARYDALDRHRSDQEALITHLRAEGTFNAGVEAMRGEAARVLRRAGTTTTEDLARRIEEMRPDHPLPGLRAPSLRPSPSPGPAPRPDPECSPDQIGKPCPAAKSCGWYGTDRCSAPRSSADDACTGGCGRPAVEDGICDQCRGGAVCGGRRAPVRGVRGQRNAHVRAHRVP